MAKGYGVSKHHCFSPMRINPSWTLCSPSQESISGGFSHHKLYRLKQLLSREKSHFFIPLTAASPGLPQVPSPSPEIAQLPGHPPGDDHRRALHTSWGESLPDP